MSLRIQHLTIDPDDASWLSAPGDGTDIINDETYRIDLLAMVRHIMRDEACTIIPIVRAAVVHPTNRWGHNMEVEVTYSKNGWRAIYAAERTFDGLRNVQCYMD